MQGPEIDPVHPGNTDETEQEEAQEGEERKPSRRQTLALPIIAAAPNLTQAAKDAGISESTLHRWLQDEHFRTELDRLPHEIAEITRQGLKDIMTQGLQVIRELMEDPDPTVRFRAARAAIVYGIQVVNAEELRREDRARREASSSKAEGRKAEEDDTG